MKRLIETKLQNWKNEKNRKPLILDGARQIGKTHSMIEFGREHYTNYVYFNFEGNDKLQNIFEGDLDALRILRELIATSGKTISKDSTLIIFDEIQDCPRAITSLKYFCENEPEYHIICAGSLLGVALNRQDNKSGKTFSYPVGKVDHLKMFPMNFQEFLWAIGFDKLADEIKNHYTNFTPMNEALHSKALELFKTYLVVGGMPASVLEYIDRKDFDLVKSKQIKIYSDYTTDMVKYSSRIEANRHQAVYNSLPSQLLKENQKFQYAIVKSGARAKDYEDSVLWLQKAGIALFSYLVPVKNAMKLPLEAYKDNFSFKVFLSDVGLLSSKLTATPEMILTDINLAGEVKGAITENYLAQELTANEHNLYYWESSGIAEVDFILQLKSDFIPLECKSAENTRSRSLTKFVEQFKPVYSIRVSTKNFGFENNIKSVPLYAVWCIR
ncbi:MAG: ATP-binding protein [Christensenellaceae bacterium]|jgi:predicted AAA+ superfamily ATPase|nr:ATP-binding protein [Christensenellaceae bacterium]